MHEQIKTEALIKVAIPSLSIYTLFINYVGFLGRLINIQEAMLLTPRQIVLVSGWRFYLKCMNGMGSIESVWSTDIRFYIVGLFVKNSFWKYYLQDYFSRQAAYCVSV